MDNCVGSLPYGHHRLVDRIGGPIVVGIISIGAHVSNQRSRCVREGLGDVQHPVQLDVPESIGFAHSQLQNFTAVETQ